MKKILFPTDFSEAANNAFIYALNIAKATGASLTTLHVYRPPNLKSINAPVKMREFVESYDLNTFHNYKDSIPELRKIAEEAGMGSVPMYHVLKEGNTIDTILGTAKEDEADMIVMGTTGANGFKELFMGSTAGEILENADRPVLAIPDEASFDGLIDQIAFSTSFADDEEKALDKVLEFAALFNAKVHVINVDVAHTSEYTHKMEALQAKYTDKENMIFQVLEGNDIYEVMTAYLQKEEVDFLAMLTKKRTFFQELFNYSRTKKMSYHCGTPVYAIQAHTI